LIRGIGILAADLQNIGWEADTTIPEKIGWEARPQFQKIGWKPMPQAAKVYTQCSIQIKVLKILKLSPPNKEV
jgi:hypothetical protein